MGGARLRARNRALALRAAESVAASLGTELGGAAALFHAMAAVRLPGELPATYDTTGMLRDVLWERHRIEAAFNIVAGGVYLRISAQAYNDDADYDGLGPLVADAVTAVLKAQA
jgi:isopenicillin-N epimerase